MTLTCSGDESQRKMYCNFLTLKAPITTAADDSLEYIFIVIPRYTLVAGYYVFMLAVRVSVRPSVHPSVVHTSSVRTSFPLNNLSIYKLISFKFCICISTNNVSLGIVNGQISIIYHEVTALVNVQKMVFGL